MTNESGWVPYSYLNEDNEPSGAIVEYWKLWGKKNGYKIEFLLVKWKETFDLVRNGKADIHGGIIRTEKRGKTFDFSDQFMALKSGIFVERSLKIRDGKDLENHIIGLVDTDFVAEYIRNNHPTFKIKSFETLENLKSALQRKEIAGLPLNYSGEGLFIQAPYKEYKDYVLVQPLYEKKLCAAVKKGNLQLLEIVNHGIEILQVKETKRVKPQWEKIIITLSSNKAVLLVVGVMGLCIILLLLLVMLLLQRLRQKIVDKKNVELLLVANKRFIKIFESSPAGMCLTTLEEDKILDVNKSCMRITGYGRKETVGSTSIDIGFWVIGEDRLKAIKMLKEYGNFRQQQFVFRHKSGEIRTGKFSADIIDIENEQCILSAFEDITELKKAEEALQKSEEKYRSMMEAMGEPTYICSSDFHVEYMNPAMIKRTGYDASGEPCHKVIHELDEKCPWCIFEKITRGESINHEIVSPKDDKTFHIANSPIFHKNGSVSKLTIFRDVTKFKKMEANLQQAQKMESIGTLAGGIAHDFNNILFPILGHTEMLLEDVSEDSPHRNKLKAIYNSSLRAKDLVKQILTFSRQDSSELKLMKMQPIIKEALTLIRSTIPTTIEIKQDLDPNCGVIKAAPTQIHQIVMNLSTNAYHAMEDTGGELVVRLKEIELGAPDLIHQEITPGVYACLTIVDSGKGMDKTLIDKIFDPFFTTKEQGKGTGMGLSVVHGIVKSMNGDIKVDSRPNKGTEFHVYLPLAEAVKEQQQATDKASYIQNGTEHILLVDDENIVATVVQRMLERLGYQVTVRTSSIEALEAFRASSDKFDIVITDMQMPNMSGDKLAIELTKIRHDIPILLCTGFSETMSEKKAASLGIKGFLLKPIVMKDLSQKIREVLDGNQA